MEANGIGYEVRIPLSTYSALKAQGESTVFTHFHVREDEQRLYGFATTAERDLFRLLLSVSGVGPTIALAALCAFSPDHVLTALAQEDVKQLQKIRGVGRKLAERLIVELRDRVAEIKPDLAGARTLPPSRSAAGARSPLPREGTDAAMALVRLGFDRKSAEALVVARLEHYAKSGQVPDVETLIKDCL